MEDRTQGAHDDQPATPMLDRASVDRRWGKVQLHHFEARDLALYIGEIGEFVRLALDLARVDADDQLRTRAENVCGHLETMASELGWLSIEAELTWRATQDRVGRGRQAGRT